MARELSSRKPLYVNLNLIDELHANENAHSRILRMLLQYDDKDRGYWIFKSFLNIEFISRVFKCSVEKPLFENERDRIDLLIHEIVRYAIIIENKINGAPDQYEQLERYVNSCKDRYDIKQIYVIYLTCDGSKKADEISLTFKARNDLEYSSDSSGRFIALNYRDHILPWLEENVLPQCASDKQLASALYQYIDYLKGMFGKRIDLSELYMIEEKVLQEFGIDSLSKGEITCSQLEDVRDAIGHFMDSKVREISETALFNVIEKTSGKVITLKNANFGYLEIYLPITGLDNACFSIETYNGRLCYGIIYESAEKIGSLDKMFDSFWRDKGYISSDWWPCWKWLDKIYNPGDASFWEQSVSNGDFVNIVLDKYTEISKLYEEFRSKVENNGVAGGV